MGDGLEVAVLFKWRRDVRHSSDRPHPHRLRRGTTNGGKQVKEKTEVPGAGWFALATDPERNLIGLWKSAVKK